MNTNKAKILLAIILSFTLVSSCKSDPKETRDKAYAKAQEWMAKEDYESAIIEFRNALRADGGHIDSYMGMGEAFEKMGDIVSARGVFSQVIAIDNKNIPARLKLGDYLLTGGMLNSRNPEYFNNAQKIADEILAMDPSNIDGMILRGRAYSGQNELEKAIKQYEEALSFDSNNLKALLGLATAKAADNNLQEAETLYKRAVEKHPDDIEAHLAIALFYNAANRSEETLKFLKQAFELDPADSRSLSLLTGFYISQKNPEEAENVFKTAIERKPGERLPLMGMADFYLKQGKTDAGVETLNRLLGLFPGDASAQLLLADIYLGRGNEEKAEEYIQSVLKSDKGNAQAHYLLGTILRKHQALDKALEEFDSAIRLDAGLKSAYLEKANIEVQRGELDACWTTLQAVLKIDGSWSPARGAMAKLLVMRGNPEEALQQAQAVLEMDAANEDALSASAEALLALGKLEESKKDWLKLCELRPGNALYRYRLGTVEEKEKDYAAALENFRKAVELSPDFTNAINDLVYIHVQKRQYDAALAELDGFISKGSPEDEIHRFRGQVFMASKDAASAEKEWRKAVEINPQNFTAYMLLGKMYQEQNKIPQAVRELDQVIANLRGEETSDERKNKISAAYLQKAFYLQLSKNTDGAQEAYRKALDLNSENVVALNNLAWILAESGNNLEEALSLAKEAKKKAPDDPEIADTLGWIYYKMGSYTLAVNQLLLSVDNREKPAAEHYFRLGKALDAKGDKLKAKQTMRKALELDGAFEGADEARQILKGED